VGLPVPGTAVGGQSRPVRYGRLSLISSRCRNGVAAGAKVETLLKRSKDMLKVFAFLNKREDIETQAFIENYEEAHVPLICSG
jgi:hypothetical protein